MNVRTDYNFFGVDCHGSKAPRNDGVYLIYSHLTRPLRGTLDPWQSTQKHSQMLNRQDYRILS